MNKNRIARPTRLDEQTTDCVSIVIKRRDGKSGGRAGKAVELTSGDQPCPGDRTERAVRLMIAAEKSAGGIVVGTSFAEGLNVGKTLGCGNLKPAMLKIQVTGLRSGGKG
jgi:hypothetical protein